MIKPSSRMKLPSREIDRDLPGRGVAIAGAPDADEQKSRDQRELVEGVEEKEIERSEGADRAGRDEEQAGVIERARISRSAAMNQTARRARSPRAGA